MSAEYYIRGNGVDGPQTLTWDPVELQIAEIQVNRRAMLALWMIKIGLCTGDDDFLTHFRMTRDEVKELLDSLAMQSFLQRDGENVVLTQLGFAALEDLGKPDRTYVTSFLREDSGVSKRFAIPEGQVSMEGLTPAPQAEGTADLVEGPLLAQLHLYKWQHLGPQTLPPANAEDHPILHPFLTDPLLSERQNFREVLLEKRLRSALRDINKINDEPWLDDLRLNRAVRELKNFNTSQLLSANHSTTTRLLTGVQVPGLDGSITTIDYINFDEPYKNDFLAIDHFRVDLPGGKHFIVADLVLFVNGIPLVVIACQDPATTDPLEAGITRLLRYSGVKVPATTSRDEPDEAVPQLFAYNQLLLVTCYYRALCGTVGATHEHYQEWKEPSPQSTADLAQELVVQEPSSQHILVAGLLRPERLLDLVRHFILFTDTGSRTVKIAPRYHQVRAVYRAIARLEARKQRLLSGVVQQDRRGGIIWHTQGSGKSLTMVFLVRKMRTNEDLRTFKVVFVTDRRDLEEQLSVTASLIGQSYHVVEHVYDLGREIGPTGHGLVFAMIQKYQRIDEKMPSAEDINPSSEILVLVDEAHRSHDRKLHARLEAVLPNCMLIGFTGTPIIIGEKKRSHDIFGPYLDRYTIQQSELDGATLPIFYEARETYEEVADRLGLDEKYDQVTQQNRNLNALLLRRFATIREALEAEDVIAVKAEDMLRHYAVSALPNRFKAMITAVSRLAAVRYQKALILAREKLVAELRALPPDMLQIPEAECKNLPLLVQWQLRAYPQLALLEQLDFASIISDVTRDEDDRDDDRLQAELAQWAHESTRSTNILNFKKPFPASEQSAGPAQSFMAFLCVNNMLITGFDVPLVQNLYLDRFMENYALLQAIARVNRTAPDKTNGLIIDYYGIARHLKEALLAYSANDVQGALINLNDEVPRLVDRHSRVIAIFQAAQLDLANTEECAKLLISSVQVRADFEIKLKKFLESMDTVLPRAQALPYVNDMQRLGAIKRRASVILHEDQADITTAGNKVRRLIDEHIAALKVRQLFEPVRIDDPQFETKINQRPDDENKAIEMAGDLRSHIEQHWQEDPAYYNKLSERLDEILQSLQDNWSAVVGELQKLINKVREGRQIDQTGLDPYTERPFLGILEEEVRRGSPHFAIPRQEHEGERLSPSDLQELATFTKDMVAFIRKKIAPVPDFWQRDSEPVDLRKDIFQRLDGAELVEYERCEYVADRVAELARYLHVWLIEAEETKDS